MAGHLGEHISRDPTAIEARIPQPQPKEGAAKPKRRRKRVRPCEGEELVKEPRRLERQLTMSLPRMLADQPRACDVGTKRSAKGHTYSWIGYKLHVDTADGGVPVSRIITSTSVRRSQLAISLGTLTAGRVESPLRPHGRGLRFHRDLGAQHLLGPQADHQHEPVQLGRIMRCVEAAEDGTADLRSRLA